MLKVYLPIAYELNSGKSVFFSSRWRRSRIKTRCLDDETLWSGSRGVRGWRSMRCIGTVYGARVNGRTVQRAIAECKAAAKVKLEK